MKSFYEWPLKYHFFVKLNFHLNFQVGGNIFGLRESRSAAIQGPPVPIESNVLVDGTLIDLCGATLLWRSVEGTTLVRLITLVDVRD